MNILPKEIALVAGGGGFIGSALVGSLLNKGWDVISVDIKPLDQWHQVHEGAYNNAEFDLSKLETCRYFMENVKYVYNLAADMGGMGFIENNKGACMLSSLISTHMLMAAQEAGVERYFYSSSACVYPDYRQDNTEVTALKESDVYPAMPEDGYGWEKLFSERMCKHFTEDFGLITRVARFHNVYGPYGDYEGGREKAPAALCRKIANAAITGDHTIEVWGDGHQTRSFMYIDDCIEGIHRIMESDIDYPINLGSSELVSINRLIEIISDIADIEVNKVHDLTAPQGVRGRNSDNTLILQELGWEPNIPLSVGLEVTYSYIYQELLSK